MDMQQTMEPVKNVEAVQAVGIDPPVLEMNVTTLFDELVSTPVKGVDMIKNYITRKEADKEYAWDIKALVDLVEIAYTLDDISGDSLTVARMISCVVDRLMPHTVVSDAVAQVYIFAMGKDNINLSEFNEKCRIYVGMMYNTDEKHNEIKTVAESSNFEELEVPSKIIGELESLMMEDDCIVNSSDMALAFSEPVEPMVFPQASQVQQIQQSVSMVYPNLPSHGQSGTAFGNASGTNKRRRTMTDPVYDYVCKTSTNGNKLQYKTASGSSVKLNDLVSLLVRSITSGEFPVEMGMSNDIGTAASRQVERAQAIASIREFAKDGIFSHNGSLVINSRTLKTVLGERQMCQPLINLHSSFGYVKDLGSRERSNAVVNNTIKSARAQCVSGFCKVIVEPVSCSGGHPDIYLCYK